jgi:hypothetical protein
MASANARWAWVMGAVFAMPMVSIGTARAQEAVPAVTPAPGWRAVRAGRFSPLDPFHAGFGLGSGVGWVTDKTARQNAVGKSGPSLHLDFDADIYDLVTIGAALGTIFLRDDGVYTQTVIDSEGEVSEGESSMSLTTASLSIGLRTPDLCLAANQKVRLGWLAMYGYARFGHAWIGGGRSIAQCSDCRRVELDTPGGQFIEPGVNVVLKANDSWGAALVNSYRAYLGDAAAAGEWRISLMFSNW